MPSPDRFDAAYYTRYYGGRRPVHGRRQIATLANAITGWAAWWRMPIRSVLDVGAGKGYWKDWFAVERPRVRYHGLDVSVHACRTYGHELADLADWTPPRAYDLVICQSMLQYLDAQSCARAIDVLGRASRGIMFLEVPTTADRTGVIDVTRTDMDVYWRDGDWYRSRLDPCFVEIGGGLWASRSAPVQFFELEVGGAARRQLPPGEMA